MGRSPFRPTADLPVSVTQPGPDRSSKAWLRPYQWWTVLAITAVMAFGIAVLKVVHFSTTAIDFVGGWFDEFHGYDRK